MTAGVAVASLNGTLELLVLSLTGGYLAHLGVLRGAAVVTLSGMMVQVLLPALMYISVLEGVHTALVSQSSKSLAAVLFPPMWGAVVPIAGGLVGLLAIRIMAWEKADAVQRVILLCIAMGNSGNMPLLILTALCDNFAPFKADPHCLSEAAALSSLYCITWSMILWSPLFAYLASAEDKPEESEETGFGLAKAPSDVKKPGFFSPPFIAILCALGTAMVPRLPGEVLTQGSVLSPVTSAVRLLSSMAVPTSSLIVGARLYESQFKRVDAASDMVFVPERKCFGMRVHMTILASRMIIIPLLGRVFYSAAQMWKIPGKMLGVFAMIETAVPSANATVMVTVLLSAFLPNIGPQLELDVAKTLLYQYFAVPVFFTLNTALALNIVYNRG